jgi:hypothetical protein
MALREHADDAGQCLLSRKSTDGVIRSGPERRFLLRLLRPIAQSKMPTTRTGPKRRRPILPQVYKFAMP